MDKYEPVKGSWNLFKHFIYKNNNMTRVQHLLTILSEECDEVGQRASKAIRFGINEKQLLQPLTNSERIVLEFNDLYAVMEMLATEGHIEIDFLKPELILAKKAKIEKYLKYSKQCGTLNE